MNFLLRTPSDRNYYRGVFCDLQRVYLVPLMGGVLLFLPAIALVQSNASSDTHLQAATRALKEGRYNEAIQEYRLALKETPGDAEKFCRGGYYDLVAS